MYEVKAEEFLEVLGIKDQKKCWETGIATGDNSGLYYTVVSPIRGQVLGSVKINQNSRYQLNKHTRPKWRISFTQEYDRSFFDFRSEYDTVLYNLQRSLSALSENLRSEEEAEVQSLIDYIEDINRLSYSLLGINGNQSKVERKKIFAEIENLNKIFNDSIERANSYYGLDDPNSIINLIYDREKLIPQPFITELLSASLAGLINPISKMIWIILSKILLQTIEAIWDANLFGYLMRRLFLLQYSMEEQIGEIYFIGYCGNQLENEITQSAFVLVFHSRTSQSIAPHEFFKSKKQPI